MRMLKTRWLKLGAATAALTAIVSAIAQIALPPIPPLLPSDPEPSSASSSVPQPEIKIEVISTNEVQISITNGVSFANYELYHRTFFDAAYPWTLHTIGTTGQTNFTADRSLLSHRFFRVAVGNDWDQDGIQNWQDADPTNSNVGTLWIVIDSPANGATFQ